MTDGGRAVATALLMTVAACTAGRDRLLSGEAWSDAVPVVYPADPHAVKGRLRKMLAMWEFAHGPDADDPAILNVYDRDEPVAPEHLVARVRIEPGPRPATTQVTAIGVRARAFGWDYRYRMDKKIHESLARFFHG